jgi:hypothetical protein
VKYGHGAVNQQFSIWFDYNNRMAEQCILKRRRNNFVWPRAISFAISVKEFTAQTGAVILPVNTNAASTGSFVVIAFLLAVDSFHAPAVIAENVTMKF